MTENQEQSEYQVVIENGRYGLIDKDNYYIIPPVYDEILKVGNIARCRAFRDWEYIDFVERSVEGNRSMTLTSGRPAGNFSSSVGCIRNGEFDRTPFNKQKRLLENGCYVMYDAKTGKLGMKDCKSRWILPCQFDAVYKWDDCELIATRIGTTFGYYNLQGKQLLPDVKYGDGADDPYGNFGHYGSEGGYLMTKQLADDDDPLACICHGLRLHLGKTLFEDMVDDFKDNSEYRQLDYNIVKTLLNKETYSHSLYLAKSSSDKPTDDCFKQLDMLIGDNDLVGYEIVAKMWTNSKSRMPQTEVNTCCLELSRRAFGYDLAYGIDEMLKDGEVKFSFIVYYASFWEDGRSLPGFCESYPNANLQQVKHELAMYEECLVAYKETLVWDYSNQPWAETEDILDYLVDSGFRTGPFIYECVRKMIDYSHNKKNKDVIQYYCNCVKWALEKGMNVNQIIGGNTAIDLLYNIRKSYNGKVEKHNLGYLTDTLHLLEQYHAKTVWQLCNEEEEEKSATSSENQEKQ
ncbi:MAG: hypothetical protein LKG25_08360 [Prevotella sp.]|jgi:hypothetical protein|nr:hypothetical protein [Prevotella sp.]MCI1282589.1 hypothetical protein [Prevotella sp.]